MCFTNPIYIFILFGAFIPDWQLSKLTENTHKIAQIYRMPKNCLRWGGGMRMGG